MKSPEDKAHSLYGATNHHGDDGCQTDHAPKDQWADIESEGAGCFITIFMIALILLCVWAWSFWKYVL
jgi:hypothetical protein